MHPCSCTFDCVAAEDIAPCNEISAGIEKGDKNMLALAAYKPCRCAVGAILRQYNPHPEELRELLESGYWNPSVCLAISLEKKGIMMTEWNISPYTRISIDVIMNNFRSESGRLSDVLQLF